MPADARARGASLVVSLHDVNLARERFTRLVGLRDGQLQFDLPAADVTDERLRELYAQRDGLYRETAHYVIETGRPTVSTLVNMVMMQLEMAESAGGAAADK